MIDYTKSYANVKTVGYDEGLRKYMLSIYNYMGLALLITAIAAFATLRFEPLTRLIFEVAPGGHIVGNTGLGTILMIAPLAIVLYFFMGFGSLSLNLAKVLLWVYATLIGISLSTIGLIYTGESIAKTFFITSSVFGAMSIYGYTTNRDLTSIGSFLVMGLFGLLIASLVNLFFKSPAVDFATSLLGVGIFTGLIAWDTQKIKAMYYSVGGGEYGQKMAVLGAFQLYLDFINLALYLLKFFGNKRD